jgi:hypothetical protein
MIAFVYVIIGLFICFFTLTVLSLCQISKKNAPEKFDLLNHEPIHESKYN